MRSGASFFILILICSFLQFSTVQAQQLEWASAIGSTGNDYGRAVTTDANGNLYTAGFFTGTVDFDPGSGTANLTSAGGLDVFIYKTNPSGALIWAHSIGSTGTDASYAIA
ncbi:MAG: SBBP repeat-containing protein, partial [Bacteroidota bacterium]|nr:SBBP repeat-containing protein [Bacteroidota bacterium]